MKFLDQAKISIKAGNGGSGSASFRREKFVEYGEQVAWLVEENKPEEQVISKPAIAKAVLDRVASWL